MCNRTVSFVLKHEKRKDIFFSSLQSSFAKKELGKFGYDFNALSTFAFVSNGEVFYKSSAALKAASFLKWPYNWLGIFGIVPPFIRNAIYDLVARNRKKWFKKEFCVVPDQNTKQRFLDT